MQPGKFSRTAQVMALFRALETVRPAPLRLLSDPFAITIIPARWRTLVRAAHIPWLGSALHALIDRIWPGARSSGVARTRLIDDWLTDAVKGGAQQIVILGAGFDSRAWRIAALAGLAVFEVDHPTTSLEKQNFISASKLDASRIVQVPIDFNHEVLAATLAKHGFDPARRTFVIWEGVTNYLTEAAVEAVLGWAASLPAETALAFTYIHAAVLTNPETFAGAARILNAVAKAGEPWTFGLAPEELPARLQALGLTLVEDLGADQYRARYASGARPASDGYAFYRAALAAVPPHHAQA